MGLLIVTAVLFMPGGLSAVPGRIKRALQGGSANDRRSVRWKPAEASVKADKITRRFGGLLANQVLVVRRDFWIEVFGNAI